MEKNKQPEALLALADRIEEAQGKHIAIDPQAAAELRRLHETNQELLGLLEALSMWLRLHETPAGYEGKYGKALDAAITAQQVKIDAAANAARAAIAKATGEQP